MGRGLFLAIVGLAVILSAARADAQTGSGTMNVHVMPPAGKTLTQSAVTAVSTGFTRATAFGAGNGPFVMTNLPVASGYTVEVVSQTTTTNEICGGLTSGIQIVASGTTIAFVSLTCGISGATTAVPALGRYAPLLFVSLVLFGAIAIRRRVRSG